MYLGLDVHKRVCYGTLTNANGQVIKRGKFSNDEDGLKSFMQGIDRAQVAMEAARALRAQVPKAIVDETKSRM